MKRSLTLLTAATLVAGGAIGLSPAAATSDKAPRPTTTAEGLFTPLKLAVDRSGTAYVSQNFLGELLKIKSKGATSTFATAPGEELGGVSEHDGTVYWTTTGDASAKMFAQRRGHGPEQIADLYAYEADKNPDQRTTYGFRDLDQACADQFPEDNPASYTGIVDSHPYATLVTHRAMYVADAAGNSIVEVGKRGKVSKVAVMPAVGSVVTEEALQAIGLPACAAGHTYYFEFVPTDVEQGRDGWLYVTSLPGGPEDASFGARGAVFKVNPRSGAVRKVAGGFVGAVDLALGPDGRIAVAELFGGAEGAGQVTLIRPGSSRRQTLALSSPGAVEWTGNSRHSHLYVTTDAFVNGEPGPTGKLQVLTFGSHRH